MTCDEVDELLGAYALDALPPDEMQRVRDHLAGCPDQAKEAADLRAAARRLAAVAETRTPPSELRDRVLAAIAQSAQDPAVSAEAPASSVAAAAGAQQRTGWTPRGSNVVPFRERFSPLWGAIAAVLVLAIAGLLIWNITLLNGRGDGDVQRLADRATSVLPLRGNDGAGSGVVVYYGSDKKAMVVADGLRPLDASAQTYQVWAIDGDAPTSLGFLTADASGRAIMVVPFDASQSNRLGVTIEPAGGSASPSTAPILEAELVG